MTTLGSRALIRAASLHARRAGQAWTTPIAILVGGGALAAWVASGNGVSLACGEWLVGCVVAFAVAFVRVPFHVYWRTDAALLAQLPIAGGALFDAAMWRAARAAVATALAVAIGAVPLALRWDSWCAVRALAITGALATVAAGLIPAVCTLGATLVATTARSDQPVSPAILGALPGAAGAFAIAGVVFTPSWIVVGGAEGPHRLLEIFAAIMPPASVLAWAIARAVGARHMPEILRSVSALDRQLLAKLEIHPPTAIERAIAGLIGDGALPYRKNARLVRRKHPMAFALGALAFLVLVIVGAAQPAAPTSTAVIAATLAIVGAYAVVMLRRLARPPLELPRLSATLPFAASAVARARAAWVAGWLAVFVAAPAVFAIVRNV